MAAINAITTYFIASYSFYLGESLQRCSVGPNNNSQFTSQRIKSNVCAAIIYLFLFFIERSSIRFANKCHRVVIGGACVLCRTMPSHARTHRISMGMWIGCVCMWALGKFDAFGVRSNAKDSELTNKWMRTMRNNDVGSTCCEMRAQHFREWERERDVKFIVRKIGRTLKINPIDVHIDSMPMSHFRCNPHHWGARVFIEWKFISIFSHIWFVLCSRLGTIVGYMRHDSVENVSLFCRWKCEKAFVAPPNGRDEPWRIQWEFISFDEMPFLRIA